MLHLWRPLNCKFSSLCWLLLQLFLAEGYNLDTNVPIFKLGAPGTYFGYSVAQHFKGDVPVLLVGAPKAQSGQVGTDQAGAIFSCPLTTVHSNYSARLGEWCKQEQVEYAIDESEDGSPPSVNPYNEKPTSINGREVHYDGKNHQQLGSVIATSGKPDSRVVVCAPLLRYHNMSAYTDGTCYVLDDAMRQTSIIHSCFSLDHEDRHNNFGACMEGFSAHVDQAMDMVTTGLPGARKWTGGVFSRLYPPDQFDIIRDRWTMDVDKDENGVRAVLAAHDYLGFSVKIGRFGFWYEDINNVTIVSGATRYDQTGAVVFLPFHKKYNSSETMNDLTLLDDQFMLTGTKLGSAFGYAVEVIDLNNDGFDDLLVGAPFHYVEDDEGAWGGAVFVYFSRGVRQPRDKNANVFFEPVQLRAKGAHSQFGLSIAKLGDIDKDEFHLNDFAVGAPFANDGRGTVFIFHGARRFEEFSAEPAQIIDADQLKSYPQKKPLTTFGFSLFGGSDLDGNDYPDLLVGAFGSDAAVLLRSRPVINVEAAALGTDVEVDKDQNVGGCPSEAQTCFKFRTELRVRRDPNDKNSLKLVDLSSNVFLCRLQVIAFSTGVAPRAKLVQAVNSANEFEWKCGRHADQTPQIETHHVYVPNGNRDWLNPLKFRFSVEILDKQVPEQPAEGAPFTNLNRFPVLNQRGAKEEFTIAFNKKCGDDKVCESDLVMQCTLPDLTVDAGGTYVKQVGEKATIDVRFRVGNMAERAYETILYVTYDSNELDVPELRKNGSKGSINLGDYSQDLVTVSLGNPLEEKADALIFELSFKLARGKSEGLGKELVFTAVVNSTSEEKQPSDNACSMAVRVIKRAELELTGVSTPDVVRYGGQVVGESAIDLEEDIGPMVKHRYTVTNHGPWSVSNVTVELDWPYEVQSIFPKGKWALYLIEMPTISTTKLDGGVEVRSCSTDLPLERINPLGVKVNTIYALAPPALKPRSRPARSVKTHNMVDEMASDGVRSRRELRIKPKLVTEKTGEEVLVVDVSCEEKTAKCFPIRCHFDFIDPDVASVIDIRARLWNSTFVEDYRDVEYVSVTSFGRLLTDPRQGIEEDQRDNFASVSTHAYPDVPQIAESVPVPWWLVAVAVAIGIFILLLIVFACWRCGFFKRNRPDQPTLYKAEFHHTQEEWAEG